MKTKKSKVCFLSFLKFLMLYFVSIVGINPSSAIIFGADDRQESFSQPKVNTNVSPSVALMASPVFLTVTPLGHQMNFNSISNSSEVALCPGERFSNQPTASVNCTGFLVAPNLLMTAGHCMTRINSEVRNTVTPQCRDFLWIFDYKYDSPNKIKNVFPFENVAKCEEVIFAKFIHPKQTYTSKVSGYGDDIALIKLDRDMGRPHLNFNFKKMNPNELLLTVGHPSGLPLKVTSHGKLQDDNFNNFFTSNLDVMDGNSGSPILNSKNEVLGIVVRAFPSKDYSYSNTLGCSKTIKCSKNPISCLQENGEEFDIPYTHGQKISDEFFQLINSSVPLIN